MVRLFNMSYTGKRKGDMQKKYWIIIFVLIALIAAAGIVGFLKYSAYKSENAEADGQSLETPAETKIQESDTETEVETESETETEPETEFKNGKKVAIDPGHQGWNIDMSEKEPMGPGSSEMKAKATSGTSGRFTGVPEYELVLNISIQLRAELESRGYEVLLTREDNDTAISNKERALLAADSGADIYVRIHANGSEDSSVNGAMTMIPSSQNPYVGYMHEECKVLGQSIIDAYCAATGMKNNGVQIFDNMTGINWSKIPVTIIEMGFMTNEKDDVNMEDEAYQEKMVQGIADGIDGYFEIMSENDEELSDDTASNDEGSSDDKASNGKGSSDGIASNGAGSSDSTTANHKGSANGLSADDEKSSVDGSDPQSSGSTLSGASSDMKAAIEQYIRSNTYSGETWSVCALSADGENMYINERQMQAASLIKLFIMGAVYENYDEVTNVNGQSKVDGLLYSMITVSDNDAANSLTKMLGNGDAAAGRNVVSHYCTSHGYTQSSMGRMLLESNASGDNYTSVGDCAKFLQDVYQKNLAYSDSMLSLLKQQQRTGKIPAGVPYGVTTANKTGELSQVENDAAIIFGEKETYILCVMSENLSSTSNARSVIKEVSASVYEYFNGQ